MTLVALCAVVLGAPASRRCRSRSRSRLRSQRRLAAVLVRTPRQLADPRAAGPAPAGGTPGLLEGAGGRLARNPPLVGLALALSSLNHLACALSIWLVAIGLGSDLGFLEVLVVSTVATLSAIPGTGRARGGGALFGSLFELAEAWAIGVATSLAWRLVLVGLACSEARSAPARGRHCIASSAAQRPRSETPPIDPAGYPCPGPPSNGPPQRRASSTERLTGPDPQHQP